MIMKSKPNSTRRPRLKVFKSNRHIYAQIIDDVNEKVITGVSSLTAEIKEKKFSTPRECARSIGNLIAKKALLKKVKKITFDRGRFKYHGNLKELADGAREGGLEF